MQRLAVIFVAAVAISKGAFVYECGALYDCVTPFAGRVRAPLPPAASIPYPEAINPALFQGAMSPQVSNAFGHIGGSVGFSASSPLPFFFDGVRSLLSNQDMFLQVIDISDTDLLLIGAAFEPNVFTYQASPPVPAGGPFFMTATALPDMLGGGIFSSFIYSLTGGVSLSANGQQMLLIGSRRDFTTGTLLQADLQLLYSTVPVAAVPEPGTALLTLTAVIALTGIASRRSRR